MQTRQLAYRRARDCLVRGKTPSKSFYRQYSHRIGPQPNADIGPRAHLHTGEGTSGESLPAPQTFTGPVCHEGAWVYNALLSLGVTADASFLLRPSSRLPKARRSLACYALPARAARIPRIPPPLNVARRLRSHIY